MCPGTSNHTYKTLWDIRIAYFGDFEKIPKNEVGDTFFGVPSMGIITSNYN